MATTGSETMSGEPGAGLAGSASPAEERRRIEAARDALRPRLPFAPEAGIILGTGLGQFASALTDAVTIPYAEIPHFPRTAVESHAGDFIVGGFTDPQGGRVGLGALLVGHRDGDDFVFAGKVGTGFDTKLLLALRSRLGALEIAATPFTIAKGLPRVRAHWVKPEVIVHVAFIEWTVHRKLRHSRLLEVRS